MYVDFNKKSLSQGHTKIIHAFHFAIEFRLQWSQILRSSGVLRILIIYYSSIFWFLSYTISHPKFGGDTVVFRIPDMNTALDLGGVRGLDRTP